MNRVNAILQHPEFIRAVANTVRLETGRKFCGHGSEHLLEVARIAYILSLESGSKIEKEQIYAAALLHDTGRGRQYEDAVPHERESARIAAIVLPDCGFSQGETEIIIESILAHRTKTGEGTGLAGFIYRADKISRRCFDCAAADECNWTIKNTRLEY